MAEECEFYYYDGGGCCAVKREKEGNSSIDSDTVHNLCWGYHYEKCARYKNRDKYYRSYDEIKDDEEKDTSSGPCFLTSACVETKGLPDDCHELQTLRGFRDGYLRNLPTGEEEIQEYYRVAPLVVKRIKEQPDALRLFEAIYNELIVPCVAWIEQGENERAHIAYRDYILQLQAQYV